jgi:hypothetical protein
VDTAEKHYRRGLAAAARAKDGSGKADARQGLGLVALARGDRPTAIRETLEALEILRGLGSAKATELAALAAEWAVEEEQ